MLSSKFGVAIRVPTYELGDMQLDVSWLEKKINVQTVSGRETAISLKLYGGVQFGQALLSATGWEQALSTLLSRFPHDVKKNCRVAFWAAIFTSLLVPNVRS